MKKTFAVVAVLLAILMGCQKDEQSKNSNRTSNPRPKISLQSMPADTGGNDSIGIMHNDALGSLIGYSRMNGGISKDECFIFLNQYYASPSDVNRAGIYSYAQKLMIKQPINSNEILAMLPYSKNAKQLLQLIIDTVLQQQALNLQLLNDKLATFENKARQGLKGDELSVVLQLISVSRYSAMFWKTYFGDHPIPGGEGLWKVLAIIHADNCGFLVGVVMGDPGFWSSYFSATVGFEIFSDNKVDI